MRLELVDDRDASRWCTANDVWERSASALEVAREARYVDLLVDAIGDTVTRIAFIPGMADLALEHEPTAIELELDVAEDFIDIAPAELERLGIDLIGPERLVKTRVSVSGEATPAPADDRKKQFGHEALVDWKLVVGDETISEAELARAAEAGGDAAAHRPSLGPHRRRRTAPQAPPAHRPAQGPQPRRSARAAAARQRRRHRRRARPDHARRARVGRQRRAPRPRLGAHPARRAPRRGARGDARVARLHRRTPSLPTSRAVVDAVPRQARPRRLPRRRHGPRQDGHDARPSARTTRPAPRGVPAERRAQLEQRGATVHTETRGADPPRQHAQQVVGAAGPNDSGMGAEMLFASDPERQLVITTYGLLPRDLEHLGAIEWSTRGPRRGADDQEPEHQGRPSGPPARAGQKLALTGTPVENRLSELWAILDAVNPGLLGGLHRFRARFGTPIERNNDADAAAARCAGSRSRSSSAAPRPTAVSCPTCPTRSSRSPTPS